MDMTNMVVMMIMMATLGDHNDNIADVSLMITVPMMSDVGGDDIHDDVMLVMFMLMVMWMFMLVRVVVYVYVHVMFMFMRMSMMVFLMFMRVMLFFVFL